MTISSIQSLQCLTLRVRVSHGLLATLHCLPQHHVNRTLGGRISSKKIECSLHHDSFRIEILRLKLK